MKATPRCPSWTTAGLPGRPADSRLVAGLILAFWLLLGTTTARATPEDAWKILEPGLELGSFAAPIDSTRGDSRITALRVDLRRWSLRLLTATSFEGSRRSPRDWSLRFGLAAAINAGMYQQDGLTSVGLLKSGDQVNNSRLNRFKAVLAFDPLNDSLPAARIIDRDCHDLASLLPGYGSQLQSIRMVSCRRENVWERQEGAWSIAALGADSSGNILFLYTSSPYAVHDFIDVILALPLDLQGAMYLEGGPQAGLFVSAGGIEVEFSGAYERRSEVPASPAPFFAPPLPNVLGVVRK